VTGLRGKIIAAGVWTLGGHFVAQVLRLGGNLVLTRLLAPEAFGVMALATVLLVGITMLSDLGLQQVVVRSTESDAPLFLDTVWTIQVLHGALITAILLVVALLLGYGQSVGFFSPISTYARPELPWVVAGLASTALIQGFSPTKFHTAARRLQLGRVVALELGSQIIGLAVMLGWAVVNPSVATLVAGAIASVCLRVLGGHWILKGEMNRFRYSADAAKKIFSFGRWIFMTSGVGFLLSNLDKLLLSWLYPAETVGLYAVASLLIMALHDVVYRVSARVAFPALSAAYLRDPLEIKARYYQARLPMDVFCLLAAGILASCGDEIVRLLYDARYQEAGKYLGILAISLIGVRFGLLSQVYCVIGRSRLMLFEQLTRLVVLLVGCGLGYHFFGLTGVVWSVALSHLGAPLVNALLVQPRLGLLDGRRELIALPIFIASYVLGLALEKAATLLR
jgi:O-antigen/teichoic acid export membrane protein